MDAAEGGGATAPDPARQRATHPLRKKQGVSGEAAGASRTRARLRQDAASRGGAGRERGGGQEARRAAYPRRRRRGGRRRGHGGPSTF